MAAQLSYWKLCCHWLMTVSCFIISRDNLVEPHRVCLLEFPFSGKVVFLWWCNNESSFLFWCNTSNKSYHLWCNESHLFWCFNRLKRRQNGCHFADHSFKLIVVLLSNTHLSLFPRVQLKTLVQIMFWHSIANKTLSDPMMAYLPEEYMLLGLKVLMNQRLVFDKHSH